MATHPSVAHVSLTVRQTLLHQLFGDHHGWLFERLRARLGCPSDAADMASETFVQVVALDDPHSIREPRALLTTIAKRLMYASWRRRDLERAYLDALANEPEQFAPSAEQQVMAVEALIEIDRLLDGLSSRARAAFLYSQLDGMTYADIARELGVSAPRVHQYVVQGLRACFEARA